MTTTDPSVLAVVAGLAAVIALVVLARRPMQWLIDHAPAQVHRAADWLGFCEEHP